LISVEVSNLSVSINSSTVLKGVSFSLREGEIALVTGPCGSGKSALLKVLAGVIPHMYTRFSVTGFVRIFGLSPWEAAEKGFVAYVPQDINTFFIGSRVCEELELLELSPNGFAQLCNRLLEELSDGELYRLLTYVAMSSGAKLLLLDEPASHMDVETLVNVLELLSRAAREEGASVIIADHRAEELKSYVDVVVELGVERKSSGKNLIKTSVNCCEQGFAAYVKNLVLSIGDRVLFKGLSFAVAKNAVLGVFGRSGAGKSTLLKVLAGIVPYSTGIVYVEKPVFYIPQKPLYWFSTGSVSGELSLYTNLFGKRHEVGEVLEQFHLQHLASRNPYTLSVGEARRLAMALAYIASPKLLLFDEPLLGLDKSSEELLTELIEGVEKGCGSVIIASHSKKLIKLVDSYLEISPGGEVKFSA
jgi:energy-coupling factor transport system ATP-binding protein